MLVIAISLLAQSSAIAGKRQPSQAEVQAKLPVWQKKLEKAQASGNQARVDKLNRRIARANEYLSGSSPSVRPHVKGGKRGK